MDTCRMGGAISIATYHGSVECCNSYGIYTACTSINAIAREHTSSKNVESILFFVYNKLYLFCSSSNSVVVITFPLQIMETGKGREFNPPFEYFFLNFNLYNSLPSFLSTSRLL